MSGDSSKFNVAQSGYLQRVKFNFLTPLLALTLAFASFAASPAQASGLPTTIDSGANNAVGLIVDYGSGVNPIAPDGSPTGANSIAVPISSQRALGDGLFALKFQNPISDARAQLIRTSLLRDSRVQSVSIDHHLDLAPSAQRTPQPRPLVAVASFAARTLKIGAFPALAPASIRGTNAFNSQTPRVARIKLSWAAPKSLNGGTLTGYRIEQSPDGINWTTIVSSTGSSARSFVVSSGISAGSTTQFRVRTLTRILGVSRVSLPSRTASVVAVVAPLSPVLVSQNVIFSGDRVIWERQSLNQRGGASVKYRVTATSNSGKFFECTTTSNSCQPTGLVATVPYTVKVSATNSVATSMSLEVADQHYGSQWYLYDDFSVHADKAWQITTGSQDVVVAVLDSGITAHPDLDEQIVAGYDFISNKTAARDGDGWDSDPTDEGDWNAQEDSSWHGTHVAGIIGAAANDIGVTGVAPGVKIQPIRVLGSTGGTESDLIAAIHWASGLTVPGVPKNQTPARVINLSMGTESASGCDSGTQSAVRAAWDLGVTPVTAAGNSSFTAGFSYPGNCYPTINVAATGVTGDIADYSNYGPGVDFSAPGGDSRLSSLAVNGSDGMILSTWNLGTTVEGQADYGLEEGTSMAAPVVSGVLALIYSVRPDLTSDDAYQVLLKSVSGFKPGSECAATAANYGSETLVAKCGAGIVDAGAAVRLAKTFVSKG